MSNPFTQIKDGQFAQQLLSAAGLDLTSLRTAGDVNALKTLLAAAKPGEQTAQLETAISEATAENTRLAAELGTAQKNLTAITEGRAALAALHTPLVEALATAGLKVETLTDDKGTFSAEKFGAAMKLRVATRARELVAASGGKVLDETPAGDATKPGGEIDSKLTGLAAVQAHFAAKATAKASR